MTKQDWPSTQLADVHIYINLKSIMKWKKKRKGENKPKGLKTPSKFVYQNSIY